MNPNIQKTQDLNTSNRKTLQPIKLKSISEEREINRTVKLTKQKNNFLTDEKVEHKQAVPLNIHSKVDSSQLQIEIALTTTRALSSIQNSKATRIPSISDLRDNLERHQGRSVSNRMSDVFNRNLLKSNTSNKILKENCLDFSKNSKSLVSISESTYRDRRSNEKPGFIPVKTSRNPHQALKDIQQKQKNKKKENLFINKIKEATIKLRKIRECLD
jgi:hypothetical protein